MTKRTVVWIVGEPGVGKTTLARELIKRLAGSDAHTWVQASPKWTGFNNGIAAAGWWRGDTFDGSDTLGISQIKPAMQYWRDDLTETRIAILDGDKLANKGAVEVAKTAGAELFCFFISGTAIAEQRRINRGTQQNPVWVTGRRTKSRNFAASFDGKLVNIDAGWSVHLMAQCVERHLKGELK